MTPARDSETGARPPWAMHGEQTIIMKKQILALSLVGNCDILINLFI